MPKSKNQCKHIDMRGNSCCENAVVRLGFSHRSLLFSSPPRKVSFEDKRNDSSPSMCNDNIILTNIEQKESEFETFERVIAKSPRRERSLLVRPITSLSLVDLAKTATHDSGIPTICEASKSNLIEERKSKRVCSFNLSPHSVVHTTDFSDERQQHLFLQPSSEGESKPIRQSPWGHFIDMAPDEEYHNNLITTSPYYGSRIKSNQRRSEGYSCKKALYRSNRRLSPYGKYKAYARGGQPTLSFFGFRTDSESPSHFRLKPRKRNKSHESAEELIGVFSELQVQHAQQSAI